MDTPSLFKKFFLAEAVLKTVIHITTYLIHVGNPIAWCISDREDAIVIETFLKAVKERANECRVQVIMTDDGECSKHDV